MNKKDKTELSKTLKIAFTNVTCQNNTDSFFDYQWVVHNEFVQQGASVIGIFYKGVLARLLKRITRFSPEKFENCVFFILHDNAPSHKAAINQQFLADKRVPTIHHSPYWPDLNPLNYFNVFKVKIVVERG